VLIKIENQQFEEAALINSKEKIEGKMKKRKKYGRDNTPGLSVAV
jgi:hypothetical protein